MASNPGTNGRITLPANAGHNAGQQAAQGAENAANGDNIFCHNDTLLCQEGQRP